LSDPAAPVTKADLTKLLAELTAFAARVEARRQSLPPEEKAPAAGASNTKLQFLLSGYIADNRMKCGNFEGWRRQELTS